MEVKEITVDHVLAGERIDKALASDPEVDLSRTFVQKLIRLGKVTVNGQVKKPHYRLKEGDVVRIEIPPPSEMKVEPEPIPLDVVYEDDDIIVVNKPAGMVVHPAAGHYSGTLVNALLYRFGESFRKVGHPIRPGIVHRLDKDTSGLMVVAKNPKAVAVLVDMMKRREIKKVYVALVCGNFREKRGTVSAPVGRHPKDRKRMAVVDWGKPAETEYEVVEEFDGYSLLRVNLKTGRTHQIRVHMSHIGHPVVGDSVYGRCKFPIPVRRQLLHAERMEFTHPFTGKKLSLTAPWPEDLALAVDFLRGRGRKIG